MRLVVSVCANRLPETSHPRPTSGRPDMSRVAPSLWFGIAVAGTATDG